MMMAAVMLLSLLIGTQPSPGVSRDVSYEAACGKKDQRGLDQRWHEVLRLAGSRKPDALSALRRIAAGSAMSPAGLLASRTVALWKEALQTYTSPTPVALTFEGLTVAEQRALSPRRPGQPQAVNVAVDVDAQGLARRVELGGQAKSIDDFERLVACKAWTALYCPARNESGYAEGSLVLTVRLGIHSQ